MISFDYVDDNQERGIFRPGMKLFFCFTKPPVQEMSFVLMQQLLGLKIKRCASDLYWKLRQMPLFSFINLVKFQEFETSNANEWCSCCLKSLQITCQKLYSQRQIRPIVTPKESILGQGVRSLLTMFLYKLYTQVTIVARYIQLSKRYLSCLMQVYNFESVRITKLTLTRTSPRTQSFDNCSHCKSNLHYAISKQISQVCNLADSTKTCCVNIIC